MNTYGYVSGNPLFSSDPFGLTEADVFFARYAISRMYPELTNNVDVYPSPLLQYTPWDGYALGESITIESKYAEKCLNEQEKEDLKNVLLHEYLHVYLNRQIGAINYLYQDTISSGQLHDWVREKSAKIRGYWNRTVPIGTPKPVLTDFPKR